MGHCHPNFSREMGDAYFFLFHYETENFFCEKSVSKRVEIENSTFWKRDWKDTVSLPCFYKRRDKNNSTSKNCHLRSLSYPINEYVFHLRYQKFIPALKRSRFLAKNSRKLLKSLEIFTFFSLSFNSKNRLISLPL